MGDSRIRYGLAYGRQNNFITGSTDQTKRGYLAGTDGLFKQADTTPDVTNGYLFYTNNSAATTISHFDLQHPIGTNTGNIAGLYEGKAIKIFFLDTNTTLSGSRIYLSGTDNSFNSNANLDLIYHNSGWYELNRVNPYNNNVSFTLGASQGLNANLTASILFSGESALVIQSVSNGYVGQRLLLINGNSATNISVSTAGNIVHSAVAAASGLYTLTSSGVVELIRTNATQWAIVGR
mgnify:FL=1